MQEVVYELDKRSRSDADRCTEYIPKPNSPWAIGV